MDQYERDLKRHCNSRMELAVFSGYFEKLAKVSGVSRFSFLFKKKARRGTACRIAASVLYNRQRASGCVTVPSSSRIKLRWSQRIVGPTPPLPLSENTVHRRLLATTRFARLSFLSCEFRLARLEKLYNCQEKELERG